MLANPKKFEEEFHFYEKGREAALAFSAFVLQREWPRQAPSVGLTLSISASSPQSSELCLGAPVLYLHFVHP